MRPRMRPMSDHELEAALRTLGEQIEWPPAPDVSGDIAEELRRRERHPVPLPRTGRGRNWGRGLLVAAMLLVPVAGTAIAATLLWNFGGIAVEVVPPTTGPTASGTLGPEALGRRIALEDAPAEIGFLPIYPDSLGRPDEVYAADPEGAYVALAWHPSETLPRIPGTPWGAVLFEVPGGDALASKDVFAGQVSPATVDGDFALWAYGEHPLDLDADGTGASVLVTGNVLLWNEKTFGMRFESLLEQSDAVTFAEEIVIP